MRALILVLDSVGIGSAPDAELYGDQGADTIRHIAEAARAAKRIHRCGPARSPCPIWCASGSARRARWLAAGSRPD
jgi:phosphopentomutase